MTFSLIRQGSDATEFRCFTSEATAFVSHSQKVLVGDRMANLLKISSPFGRLPQADLALAFGAGQPPGVLRDQLSACAGWRRT